MLKILAVEINSPMAGRELLCRRMKQQGFTTPPSREYDMILSTSSISKRRAPVNVGHRLGPSSLDPKILLNQYAEGLEFLLIDWHCAFRFL